ncbi:hypothetical protein GLAREA_05759 [Glarea lozoyensis ATCC 20868]|uniref:F-box domain-containing protein n=1 Tax=Glarea lozoyensis (strain ATCC 20868 / MF5171) TaxID=1116229 RepID=S3DWU8_GLAL2|nr:uncharacterized protein GLAREA_05759 [Glarea lozoyensis ATCC 20868]EPE36421.1 hypothetical protein GLAREA_05759 [Glarea lozoyensis ATCC 20868]
MVPSCIATGSSTQVSSSGPTDLVNSPSFGFESLPAEIQCEILQHTTDPKCLFSLITASPRFFQVFKQFRTRIISEMARNYISYELLPLALEVHERGKVRGENLDCNQVEETLNNFPDDLPLPVEHFSLQTSIALLRFHRLVEKFMGEFVAERLEIIEEYLRPDTSSSTTPVTYSLTDPERARLSRAFYNLELYGLLFPSSRPAPILMDLEAQAANFLGKMTAGQREAVLCLRIFFLERLRMFVNQFEDDFMEEYQTLEPHPFHQDPLSRWESNDWFFSHRMYPQGLDLWQEDCITRGLHMLSRMFSASNSEERREVAGNTDIPQMTMSRCLCILLAWKRAQTRNPEIDLTESEHAGEKNDTVILSWVKEARKRNGYYLDEQEIEGLRRWGYVIWDHRRLEDLGVLKRWYVEIANPIPPISMFETNFCFVWDSALNVARRCVQHLDRRNRNCVEFWARDLCKKWAEEGLIPEDWEDVPDGPWNICYLE